MKNENVNGVKEEKAVEEEEEDDDDDEEDESSDPDIEEEIQASIQQATPGQQSAFTWLLAAQLFIKTTVLVMLVRKAHGFTWWQRLSFLKDH